MTCAVVNMETYDLPPERMADVFALKRQQFSFQSLRLNSSCASSCNVKENPISRSAGDRTAENALYIVRPDPIPR